MTQTQFPFNQENSPKMLSMSLQVLGLICITGLTLYLINKQIIKDESQGVR